MTKLKAGKEQQEAVALPFLPKGHHVSGPWLPGSALQGLWHPAALRNAGAGFSHRQQPSPDVEKDKGGKKKQHKHKKQQLISKLKYGSKEQRGTDARQSQTLTMTFAQPQNHLTITDL